MSEINKITKNWLVYMKIIQIYSTLDHRLKMEKLASIFLGYKNRVAKAIYRKYLAYKDKRWGTRNFHSSTMMEGRK